MKPSGKMFRLTLPWPPSINDYYKRTARGGQRIGDEGIAFRQKVWHAVVRELGVAPEEPILSGPIVARFLLAAPKRYAHLCDVDNRNKALLDAMEKAGVYANDRQIIFTGVGKGLPSEKGLVKVLLYETDAEFCSDKEVFSWE